MFRRGCLLKSTFSVKLAFLHQNKFVEERGRAAEKAPFEAIIWENLRIQQRGLLRVCFFCEKLLHCSFLHKSWEPFLWREKQERNRGIFCFHHVNVIQLGWTELCDVKVEIIRAKRFESDLAILFDRHHFLIFLNFPYLFTVNTCQH